MPVAAAPSTTNLRVRGPPAEAVRPAEDLAVLPLFPALFPAMPVGTAIQAFRNADRLRADTEGPVCCRRRNRTISPTTGPGDLRTFACREPREPRAPRRVTPPWPGVAGYSGRTE
ncbi:hypothetical protein [Streptomyces sp. NPDC054849]